MSKNPHPKNMYASIKARLLDIARERGVDYNTLTRLYFQERFLDRLSKSRYSENLYLKGALLFMAYEMTPGRLTQDIDFLANDIKNESSELRKIFTEILSIDIDDCVSLTNRSRMQFGTPKLSCGRNCELITWFFFTVIN